MIIIWLRKGVSHCLHFKNSTPRPFKFCSYPSHLSQRFCQDSCSTFHQKSLPWVKHVETDVNVDIFSVTYKCSPLYIIQSKWQIISQFKPAKVVCIMCYCCVCKNTDLDPQTLRRNFWLMKAAFDGKLNQNSRRNDDAMSEGLDLFSYYEYHQKMRDFQSSRFWIW